MGWKIASVVFGLVALIAWGAALGVGSDYLAEAGWPVKNGEAFFNAIFMTVIAAGTGAKAGKTP